MMEYRERFQMPDLISYNVPKGAQLYAVALAARYTLTKTVGCVACCVVVMDEKQAVELTELTLYTRFPKSNWDMHTSTATLFAPIDTSVS
jgi:hypothetical protein